MWPAVPRIMTPLRSPACLLPELHRAHGASVGEMLGEKLAEQALVGAPRRIVERSHASAGEELAERGASFRRQHAPGRSQARATRAERATGGMAEHDGRALVERRVTFGAHIHRRTEAELGDDVPCAGEG